MTARRLSFFLLAICVLCLLAFRGEAQVSAPSENAKGMIALEGELRIHPKFLFKYYLTGFGDGQQCALFGPGLEAIKPGSHIRVEGKLGTRFSSGGTATNPSPFPQTCYIYMELTKIEVQREPSAPDAAPVPPPVSGPPVDRGAENTDVEVSPRSPSGRPPGFLGKYLTIEGVMPADDGKLRESNSLLVDTVNGVKLEKPIGIVVRASALKKVGNDRNDTTALSPAGLKLEPKLRYVLKGYETGTLVGTPPGAFDAAKELGWEHFIGEQAIWHWYTYFVALKIVEPAGIELTAR